MLFKKELENNVKRENNVDTPEIHTYFLTCRTVR